MRLGDTGWHLYRPDPRAPRIYDLDYMMDHLRCDLQRYGLTFTQVAEAISRASNRTVRFVDIPHEAFVQSVAESGAPDDIAWLLDYLFSTVLDGRNAYVSDGVQRALGRAPKDFADYARKIAASGIWKAAA